MVISRSRNTHLRARITSQGQITVPKAVRDQLGLKAGDELEFEPGPAGMLVRPRPRRSVLEFAGIASDSRVVWPETYEGLREMIRAASADAAAEEEARVARGERLPDD